MAYQTPKIHVKFVKNRIDIGHAIGSPEGDYMAFPRAQLRELIGRNYRQAIEEATLVILESRIEIKVSRVVEYDEDDTICIYCGADSIELAQVIPLTRVVEKNTIQRVKEYIMELVA
jgi:hypothetical protein